ncbi:MAG TPA: helix-turn-helix transcriptional regulator [Stellaceae bacterium]|nr:helix-turn-helix transcriptional regulator [Stellaceae bacterium]
MVIINGREWVPPSPEEAARQLAEYTRRVEECQRAAGLTDAEIAEIDARADQARARDRLYHTLPELRTPEMYAAAGLDWEAEMAADEPEPGEEDEPDGAMDLPTGPVLPPDFRAWRERMGWTQEQAAAALDLSRRSIIGYEQGTQPIPRTVALACWALTVAHRRLPRRTRTRAREGGEYAARPRVR